MIRGLQKTLALLTLKSELTLNTNRKCPASPTKIGSNCTPLGDISNNGRAKHSIIKSLKQQHIDAEVEWEVSQKGAARGREEALKSVEPASILETCSEKVNGEVELNRELENSTTDTIALISL